jgi:hypothetical protein
VAGYYFDEQDDSDRDCPLIFKYHAPDFAEAIGLAPAPSANHRLVRNVVLTELAMAAEIGKAIGVRKCRAAVKSGPPRRPADRPALRMAA